jgi:hypothetical protein
VDAANLFFTPTTARLLRAEYAVALAVSAVLLVLHLGDVRWWAFVLLFGYIDVLGYFPGAVAFRRAGGGPIAPAYHVLYNTMHSLVSAAAVAGAWCLLVGPEWALLALPLHLCGDRAVFGSFLKPFALSFEPVPSPISLELLRRHDDDRAVLPV